MFCNNCGSKIEDGQLFCSVCGTKVENSSVDASNNTSTNGNEQQSYSQEQNYNQEQPFFSSGYEPNYSEPTPPKKKSGIGKVVGIVAGAVALVAVATVGTLAATGKLGNFFHKNFSSPESYFQYVAKNNTDNAIKSLNSSYATAIDTLADNKELSGNLTVKLEVGESLKPLLGIVDSSLSNLENASVTINSNIDDTMQNTEIKANINDSDIATIKASLDMENETGYIQIPELSDTYLDVSKGIKELNNEINRTHSEYQQAMETFKNTLPDSKTLTDIMSTYLDIVYDNIDEVKKSSKTIKAEGVSQKCTALEATIDGKYCYNTASDILNQLSDDKNIKDIIDSIDYVSYDDFKDSIDDTIEDLKESKDNFDDLDSEALFSLYVDDKSELVGIEIKTEIDDDEIVISSLMPQNGSDFGYKVAVEYGGTEYFSLKGKGTIKKDILEGSFSLSIDEEYADDLGEYVSDTEDFISFDISDVNLKDMEDGKLNGKFTIYSDKISQLKGYELVIEFNSSNNENSVKLSITSDRSEWITLTIASGKGKKLDEIKPSDSDKVITINSERDLNKYLDDADMEAFIQSIIDASGVDISSDDIEDIIDSINDSFGSSYDDYDDYDYDDYDFDDYDDYDYDDYDFDDYDDISFDDDYNYDDHSEQSTSSLEDYVNSSEFQSQISTLKSSLDGSGMNIEVKAKDNILIYEYTYETLAKADVTDYQVKQLETGLEQQKATFELVADSLNAEIGSNNCIVRVIYIGSDGGVIAQRDFS